MKTINIFKLCLLALICVIQMSCNSTKLIKLDNKIAIYNSDFNKINGKYKQFSMANQASCKLESIWSHFHKGKEIDNLISLSGTYLEIKLVNQNRIKFNIVDSLGSAIFTKQFKCKIVDGILLIKKQNNFHLEGIPPFFYKQTRETLNIGLDKNNDLLLGFEGSSSGGILFIVFGISVNGNQKFSRL